MYKRQDDKDRVSLSNRIRRVKRDQVSLNKQWQERYKELSLNPMGTAMAAIFLQDIELRKICDDIRDEYKIDLPVNFEDRNQYLKKKFKARDRDKLLRKIYFRVGETEDIKEITLDLKELEKIIPTLEKYYQLPKQAPGRPKKTWPDWPQLDIATTIYVWIMLRVIWPLPRYFYDPQIKLSSSGLPFTFAIISTLGGKIISDEGDIKRIDLRKRNQKTFARDAYYHLLYRLHKAEAKKHKGIKNLGYIDIANYLVLEGKWEKVDIDPDIFHEKYDDEVIQICHKIEKAIKRHDLWIRDIADSLT